MKYIKNYFSFILAFIYIFLIGCFISMVYYVGEIYKPFIYIFIVSFIIFLMGIVYYILNIKDNINVSNKYSWYLFIIVFNYFIIPYYHFKYIIKSEKLVKNMVIFVFLSIFSLMLGFFTPVMIAPSHAYDLNLHDDNTNIGFIVNGYYKQEESNKYDIYVRDRRRKINIGLYLYNKSDNAIDNELLRIRDSELRNTYRGIKLIKKYDEEVDDFVIKNYLYNGNINGSKSVLVTTGYRKSTGSIINGIFTCEKNDFDKYKDEFREIILKSN